MAVPVAYGPRNTNNQERKAVNNENYDDMRSAQ